MQKLILTISTAMLLLVASNGIAQVSISAEVRPRAEFRDGFKTLRGDNDKPAFFTEQRTRLYFNYQEEKFLIHIALQDVRIWGATSQIYKSDPSLTNIYEGYGQYFFSPSWSVKAGRQAIDYNNARFFGNLGWAQQGRSHDALLFIHDNKNNGLKFHLGGAFNQFVNEPRQLFGTDYLGINNYKTMQYAWLNKKGEKGDFSLLIHNDGRQVAADTSMAYRQTLGALGSIKAGDLTIGGELYYQTGKNSVKTDVSALLLSLNATYKTSLTPLTLGFDYLSGTSTDDTKDKSFQPLYGTNHKFYGFMDYFYVGNGHGQVLGAPSGLIDIYLKTKFKLSDKSSLLAHLHNFSSPATIYNPVNATEEMSNMLGTELDLVYAVKLGANASFNLGYSTMFASETMQAIKGRGDHALGQHWAWAMLTFKPVLFTSKKEE